MLSWPWFVILSHFRYFPPCVHMYSPMKQADEQAPPPVLVRLKEEIKHYF